MSNTSNSKDFLVILRCSGEGRDFSPEQMQQVMQQFGDWMGQMQSRGQLKGSGRLEDKGKLLSGKNGQTVTDGPFAESKESVGGYVLIQARDLAEAVSIAKGCPILNYSGTVEVRPLMQNAECSASNDLKGEAQHAPSLAHAGR
ncbi:MAG: PhnB protein [Pedosphaera sp.]|nr:PhnB protein [Pedosphaera sp.]